MSHGDAILEAILAEPDELTHRLVYADWLEEHGDAAARDRAEFIRLQIDRAGLHPCAVRARAMRRRETALLARHEGAWTAPLRGLVRRWAFHRGFVEEVTLTGEQLLTAGARLFALAPLRRLNLRGTQALPTLLSGDGEKRAFSDLLCRIKVLDLNREYLNDPAGAALINLPRLPRLDGLHLGHNALTDEGTRTLARSAVLDSVRTLEFTPSTTSLWAVEALLRSPRLASLRELCLAGGRTGDRLIPLVARALAARGLRSLSVGHSNISAQGLEQLAWSPELAGLESLDLSFNPLGAAAGRLLDAALPRLRQLNLSRAELADEGAGAVAESSLPARLLGLDLSLNRIGAPGGLALAGYAGHSRLQTLDLIYNPLGAEAVIALGERFGDDVCLFRR